MSKCVVFQPNGKRLTEGHVDFSSRRHSRMSAFSHEERSNIKRICPNKNLPSAVPVHFNAAGQSPEI